MNHVSTYWPDCLFLNLLHSVDRYIFVKLSIALYLPLVEHIITFIASRFRSLSCANTFLLYEFFCLIRTCLDRRPSRITIPLALYYAAKRFLYAAIDTLKIDREYPFLSQFWVIILPAFTSLSCYHRPINENPRVFCVRAFAPKTPQNLFER